MRVELVFDMRVEKHLAPTIESYKLHCLCTRPLLPNRQSIVKIQCQICLPWIKPPCQTYVLSPDTYTCLLTRTFFNVRRAFYHLLDFFTFSRQNRYAPWYPGLLTVFDIWHRLLMFF